MINTYKSEEHLHTLYNSFTEIIKSISIAGIVFFINTSLTMARVILTNDTISIRYYQFEPFSLPHHNFAMSPFH